MANLPSVISKINDLEVGQDKPNTEALMRKIGSVINAIIDKFNSKKIFSSSTTWVVPLGTTQLLVEGCGGGGGGGGGASYGGGGGVGSTPQMRMLDVIPGETLTITIGAGGNGGTGAPSTASPASKGISGGASKISRDGTDILYFPGGDGGNQSTNDVISVGTGVPGARNNNFSVEFSGVSAGFGAAGGNVAIGGTAGRNQYVTSPATGGAANQAGGGGGGGSAYGPGGNGGDGGTLSPASHGSPGGAATSTNYGAGGGGGGARGSGSAGGDDGGAGGNGAPGILKIYFTEDVT